MIFIGKLVKALGQKLQVQLLLIILITLAQETKEQVMTIT